MRYLFMGAVALSGGLIPVALTNHLPQETATRAAKPRSKIAVVDMTWVARESKWCARLTDASDAESKQKQSELDALSKEIKRKKDDAVMYDVGTPQRNSIAIEIEMLKLKGRMMKEAADARLAAEDRKSLLKIYKRIEQMVGIIAKERGYDLVLKKANYEDDKKSWRAALQGRLASSVLYAAPALDISKAVLNLVDNVVAGPANAAGAKGAGQKGAEKKAGSGRIPVPGKDG